jgi:hypothetical protein
MEKPGQGERSEKVANIEEQGVSRGSPTNMEKPLFVIG